MLHVRYEPQADIRSSDNCGENAVPLTGKQRYDFHKIWGLPANAGNGPRQTGDTHDQTNSDSGPVVAVFATGFLSAPALAGHCPRDVKKINAAMSKLGEKEKMMAKKMSSKWLALHKAGKHGEALKVLHEAMKTLGIKH